MNQKVFRIFRVALLRENLWRTSIASTKSKPVGDLRLLPQAPTKPRVPPSSTQAAEEQSTNYLTIFVFFPLYVSDLLQKSPTLKTQLWSLISC